jgi:hypothetical protein
MRLNKFNRKKFAAFKRPQALGGAVWIFQVGAEEIH